MTVTRYRKIISSSNYDSVQGNKSRNSLQIKCVTNNDSRRKQIHGMTLSSNCYKFQYMHEKRVLNYRRSGLVQGSLSFKTSNLMSKILLHLISQPVSHTPTLHGHFHMVYMSICATVQLFIKLFSRSIFNKTIEL